MKFKRWGLILAGVGAFMAAQPAGAVITYDTDVTPDVIFGTGNPNGGWAIDQNINEDVRVEVGLRAKQRFGAVLGSTNGVYSATTGISSGTAATWNYEFAVNTDYTGTSGLFLGDVTTLISIDTDPSVGVNFVTFDIFAFTDNAVGDNSTPNGGGIETNDPLVFGNFNVAQNSQNLGFGDPPFFDANADATYDFALEAFDAFNNDSLARITIQVVVGKGGATAIPEPASALLFGVGLIGLAGLRRRRSKRA